MTHNPLNIRWLGTQDYIACWKAMRTFTDQRQENTADEIWLLEHPPVFTQGQNGKPEHILQTSNIPIIQVDRGGQVTYHGPGQLMTYTLIDIQRKKINVRELVTLLEKSVIELLSQYQIEAISHCKAPGVYVQGKKICSIGLRIRRGRSFHGLALNVNMDLTPYSQINPCGFAGMKMTQLSEQIIPGSRDQVAGRPENKVNNATSPLVLQNVGIQLGRVLSEKLEYNQVNFIMEKNNAPQRTEY